MTEKTVIRSRSRIPWMGSHSGYDRGCEYLPTRPREWQMIDVHRAVDSFGPIKRRLLNTMRVGKSASPLYDNHSLVLERALLKTIRRYRPDLVHLMYLETDLGFFLGVLGESRPPVIATAHQPASWWKLVHRRPEVIEDLDALIVLTEGDFDFWQERIPGRIYLLRHGIDVDFFSPGEDGDVDLDAPRFLTVGNWLRDLETLSSVVGRLVDEVPSARFECVFPNIPNPSDALLRLAGRGQVQILAGLTDEQLRDRYRNATALLMPMIDATANNAILEAQACGTPILSTDIPGVANYVDPSFADLCRPGDVDGLVTVAKRLLGSPSEYRRRAHDARTHAVDRLSWRRQAPRWLEVYDQVLQRGR